MPDYQKGKIYTIRCRNDDNLIYVGSTIVSLSKRFNQHKNEKKMKNTFHTKITDWDNWYIELYENYPCNNKEELNKREGEIIRQMANLNIQIPQRTAEEIIDYNKNRKHIYNTTLPQEKRDAINLRRRTKCICECGEEIIKDSKARHIKSQKHLDKMAEINQ